MSRKAVTREGRWYDGDELIGSSVGDITARVLLDDERLSRCVLCRAEQPDDVRWSRYEMELKRNADGRTTDLEYTCCPRCESQLDAVLFSADRSA